MEWFSIDRIGLRKQRAYRSKFDILKELVSNCVDAEADTVTIKLVPVAGRPLAQISVEDNSPEGFKDLTHAWTLFAESARKGDPSKRGRFNVGEKLVLAFCDEATISTTTGTVIFDKDGRHHHPRQKRERGSLFDAVIHMTRSEFDEVVGLMHTILVPEGVTLRFNDDKVTRRPPVHIFEAQLPTEISDLEGQIHRTARKTKIELYERIMGDEAAIYELGMPVVETGDKYHVNVLQKVPLNLDRDNVTPAYLRAVRTLVLNEMHNMLTKEEATAPWVREAASDERCTDDAITTVMDQRFGEKRAAFDPNDPEANNRLVAGGTVIVPGGAMSGGEWKNAKRAEAIVPAGQISPTPKVKSDPKGAKPLDESEFTPGMRRIVDYTTDLARLLLDEDVVVDIYRLKGHSDCAGFFGGKSFGYNLTVLGEKWFDQEPTNLEVVDLIVHELGHFYEENHLDEKYHKALTRLAAKLLQLALDTPEFFGRKPTAPKRAMIEELVAKEVDRREKERKAAESRRIAAAVIENPILAPVEGPTL